MPVGSSVPKLSQNSVQQSALLEQVASGCAQVALRQVQIVNGNASMHPHTLEQQSELTSQLASTARHGAARHVPLSQMPVQH